MLIMTFKNLLNIREDNNLTQKDIAKILHTSQQNYSLWENNTKIIPLKHLNNLSNFYNLSLDYLLGLSNIRYYENSTSDIDKKIIGKRLKEFRHQNNLTQEQLAGILNTTHSTISAYEHGKTTILTAFAYEICKRYNISMDYLCGKTK